MKAIIKNRGDGKTLELIKESAETGFYIIVKNSEMAYYTAKLARKKGFIINFPLTYSEFLNRKYVGKNIEGFLFDDVDVFLQELSRVPIYAFTSSSIELPHKRKEPVLFTTSCRGMKF